MRKNSGSMLVLITAVTVGLVLAVIIFSYNYVRLFASQGQSKNAIDAASLAAAGDLSRIVVNTAEYGYVSLSDSAPTGPVTVASDQYYLPVRGINSLIATCRLENQLAIAMKDPVLSALAQYDLIQAQSAVSQLETALVASLKPKGKGSDIYGNDVTPYADAEAAFKANDLRQGQQYVNSSLTLSLGGLSKPIPTNIPIPQPTNMGGLQSSQSLGGYYLSDMPVPFGNGTAGYGSQNVSFAAIAQSTRLVDPKTFTTQVSGIATNKQMLAVVKAVANEQVTDSQNEKGLNLNMISCAIPANNYDPRPAPGALSISFPDGPISDWKTPLDMMTDPQLAQNITDLQKSIGGDYPTDNSANLGPATSFWIAAPPSEANIARVCIYDWVRRAGARANIQSIIDALNTSFATTTPTHKDWWAYTATSGSVAVDITQQAANKPQIPQGAIHIYKFNADGTVAYSSKNLTPWPYAVLSENQLFGESLGGFTSAALSPIVFSFPTPVPLYSQQNQNLLGNSHGSFDPLGKSNVSTVTFSQYFDVYFRDEVRQPGKTNGGMHGGEPLNNTQVALNSEVRKNICDAASYALHGTGTDYGAGGSGAWGNNGHGGGQHGSGPPGGNGGSGSGGQGPGGNSGGWGGGATPMIEPQSDFGETSYPAATYTTYSKGSGQVRPTYTTNGTAIDIRFRRQLTVNQQMSADLSQVSDVGYLGYLKI